MAVVVIMFACGLICGRSKYFGETVVALYFLLVYKPGFLKTLTVGHMTVIAMVLYLCLQFPGRNLIIILFPAM